MWFVIIYITKDTLCLSNLCVCVCLSAGLCARARVCVRLRALEETNKTVSAEQVRSYVQKKKP